MYRTDKTIKREFCRFCRFTYGHIVKNNIHIQVVSNWWLFYYADVESVKVAIWPPVTYAEAMTLNPTAIAAYPTASPINETLNVGDHGV